MKERWVLLTGILILHVICLNAILGAGCLENGDHGGTRNRTEAAIGVAMNDSTVREQIPIESGEYEIVNVGPVQYEQTGPNGTFLGIFTAVTFRCSGQRSHYRVIVDDANATIVSRDWQWVKEPLPCSGGETFQEFTTFEEASEVLMPGCAYAIPTPLPDGYVLSSVRVYGQPCTRRESIYLAGEDTLRLVQTCNGSPSYPFALHGSLADDVTVHGMKAEFIRGIGENQVKWSDEKGSYWLSGPLEKTDLLAAASSVQMVSPEDNAVQETSQRRSLNVLRGEPFSINGSVRNPGISRVQVWVMSDEISTCYIPVMHDGSYQYTLSPEDTRALPRDFSLAIVVHTPQPPDNFTITWDESTKRVVTTGSEIPALIVSHLEDPTLYPTTLADYLEQAILKSGQGIPVQTYFLNGVDGWITIDPVHPSRPGTLVISGRTSLPAGTPLSLSLVTAFLHPTPKNYDWSHEMADGSAVVVAGAGGINGFSDTLDTSKLHAGKYLIGVESRDTSLQADATGTVFIIAPEAVQPGNFIDWNQLVLPSLEMDEGVMPEMLEGGFQLLPPGRMDHNNEIPYGSIIDCGVDGVCRVFNKSGIQFLSVYYSNEARMVEVPNGAFIDSERVGNVTFVELDGDIILVKIDEYSEKV
ncbi:MAG: hypothetical protein WC502_06975 [Methanolinea sp.]|jgi:hypothetical protein